jgi:hypothetical protein
VLQKFELEHKRLAGDAEITGIDPDDRRTPDVRADQPLGRGDPRPVNNQAADRGLRRAVGQNCTLPSDGGAVRTGGGRCCTAGRGILGGGNAAGSGGGGGGGGRTSTGSAAAGGAVAGSAAAGSAGGDAASGAGGAGGIRGGCSQPPGTISALAVTLTGSAGAVESTIATAKIGTFRISLPLPNCAQ